jgi:hypothetical protein
MTLACFDVRLLASILDRLLVVYSHALSLASITLIAWPIAYLNFMVPRMFA